MIQGINRDGTGSNHGGAAPNLTPPRLARTRTRTRARTSLHIFRRILVSLFYPFFLILFDYLIVT